MKRIVIYLLCFSMVLVPGSIRADAAQIDMATVEEAKDYTVVIPDDPTSVIIYYHCHNILYHSEERTPRTKYNFQEDYVETLTKGNPNSIVVVTYFYNAKLIKHIKELIKKYKIPDIIVSGWSAGGNDAVRAAATLAKLDTKVQLLLIDCNHTDEVKKEYVKTLKTYKVQITYTSNTISKAKNKKLHNIMSYKIPINYLKLKIPEGFSGSNHMYCRNSTMNYNLYGYLLGTSKLNTKHYKTGYYDYKKGIIMN